MAMIKQAPKYRYLTGNADLYPTNDNMGARVPVLTATLLNGENKGEAVTEVKLNQLVLIKSTVGPRKFNAFAGYNPKLAEFGAVSMNPVLEDGQTLELVIKARKPFQLADLDFIFQIWVTD